jgi:hypothetical protein
LRSITQPKLAIGEINSPLEREADRTAEQVMRMPDREVSVTAARPQVGRKCAACQEEAANTLQAKPPESSKPAAGEAPSIVHEVLRAPGQPLDASTRTFFESRFGRDFSQVCVHTDQQAALSAQSVGALAYTVGPHIAFAAGQYAPATDAGKALLAHELVHTLQRAGSPEGANTGGVLSRRVVGVNCPPNQFNAPADPRADLEAADTIAIDLANQMAQGLATDAQTVQGGIPDDPSETLQAFENHFGLPIAAGAGFLNRLTGVVRPTQEVALSEELSIVSRRFAGVARVMGQGLSYICPGDRSLSLAGCPPGPCGTADATSCPDNSLVGICPPFWPNFGDTGRAQILIHETLHINLGNIGVGSILDTTTRGPGRNFNIAGCYEALVQDITGVVSATCPDVPAA